MPGLRTSAPDAASAFLQGSALACVEPPATIAVSLVQVYDQVQQYRTLSQNRRHVLQLLRLILCVTRAVTVFTSAMYLQT